MQEVKPEQRPSKVFVENKTLEFKRREFPTTVHLQKGINRLSYGTCIYKLVKKGKGPKLLIPFYINQDDSTKLQWNSPDEDSRKSQLDLCAVTSVSDSPSFPLPKKLTKLSPLLLTIFYGSKGELLLVFENVQEKIEWWAGLEYFIQRAHNQRRLKPVSSASEIARELFNKADLDDKRLLEKEEIRKIIKRLKINIDNNTLSQKLQRFDKGQNGTFDIKEFDAFIQTLMRKQELFKLFTQYALAYKGTDDEPVMTMQELIKFYKEEQKINIGEKEALEIVNWLKKGSVSTYHNFKKIPKLSFYDFGTLIFSNQNPIFNSEHAHVYQDMTRPLTDYYMNSSHNTYLIGNQLTSTSSIKGYIRSLELGCRSVEIDLWNGDNAEPIVTHGHTLTSKILFRDLIVALKEHAFVRTEYPLIFSFEMHCDIKGQQKIASILEAEIKDQIFVLPQDYNSTKFYPSPENLKKKYVIKSKGEVPESLYRLNSFRKSQNGPFFDGLLELHSEDDEPHPNLAAIDRVIYNKASNMPVGVKENLLSRPYYEEEEKRIEGENVFKNDYDQNANSYVHRQLKNGHDLFNNNQDTKINGYVKSDKAYYITQTQTEKIITADGVVNTKQEKIVYETDVVEHQIEVNKKKKVNSYNGLAKYYTLFGIKMNLKVPRSIWNISSLSEDKVKNLLRNNHYEIVDFCKKYMVRIFPLGTRVGSSNYDPTKSWIAGAQMVALNYQTSDESMLLNYAKYAANGGAGYVLKPEYLTSTALFDKSKAKYPHDFTVPKLKLRLRIISGQQFQFEDPTVSDIIDPFVEVRLKGIEVDEERNLKYRTHILKDNGFNPVWSTDERSCIVEYTIIAPELATLIVKVFDGHANKKRKLAWYAIEMPHIVEGHRVLPMLNSRFDQIPHCFLYVHVKIEHLRL